MDADEQNLSSMLTRTEAALDSGDPVEALDWLLRCWQESRDARVADLVEDLSARSVEVAPRGTWAVFPDEQWKTYARAHRSLDLPLVLAELQIAWDTCSTGPVVAGVSELTRWPPDPRLGRWAAKKWTELRSRPSVPATLDEKLRRIMIHSADSMTLAVLTSVELPDHAVTKFRARVERVLKRARRTDDVELQVGCDRLRRRVEALPDVASAAGSPTEASTTEPEWAAVYAAPDADEPRVALAAALTAKGDLRGEFIELQLRDHRGVATPADKRREQELLREHGRTWLGALAPLVSGRPRPRYERGFPVSVVLKRLTAEATRTEGEHPEWATLEHIAFANSARTSGSFVSERMVSLRSVANLCRAGLRSLCGVHSDLRIQSLVPSDPRLDMTIHELSGCTGLPALRELHLTRNGELAPEEVTPLWNSSVGARLESLIVQASDAATWFRHRPPVSCLAVHEPATWWALIRDDDGARLTGYSWRHDSRALVLEVLAQLPPLRDACFRVYADESATARGQRLCEAVWQTHRIEARLIPPDDAAWWTWPSSADGG